MEKLENPENAVSGYYKLRLEEEIREKIEETFGDTWFVVSIEKIIMGGDE